LGTIFSFFKYSCKQTYPQESLPFPLQHNLRTVNEFHVMH